jgi:hypothetical protein
MNYLPIQDKILRNEKMKIVYQKLNLNDEEIAFLKNNEDQLEIKRLKIIARISHGY